SAALALLRELDEHVRERLLHLDRARVDRLHDERPLLDGAERAVRQRLRTPERALEVRGLARVAHVDDDERPLRARARGVERARGLLLADAVRAEEEHRFVGAGALDEAGDRAAERARASDEPVEARRLDRRPRGALGLALEELALGLAALDAARGLDG